MCLLRKTQENFHIGRVWYVEKIGKETVKNKYNMDAISKMASSNLGKILLNHKIQQRSSDLLAI